MHMDRERKSLVSRRSLFNPIAAAAVVGVTGGSAVAAIPKSPTATENRALLALAGELEAALQEYCECKADKQKRLAWFAQVCPPVPEILVVQPNTFDDEHFCSYAETDAEGREIRKGDQPARKIIRTQSLELDIQDYGPRTKKGKRARQLLAIARPYEDAVAQARLQTNVDGAIELVTLARDALEKVAQKIGEAEALTMDGLWLKAHAINVCSSIGEVERFRALLLWSPDLARSVQRIMGGQANA